MQRDASYLAIVKIVKDDSLSNVYEVLSSAANQAGNAITIDNNNSVYFLSTYGFTENGQGGVIKVDSAGVPARYMRLIWPATTTR